MTRRIAFIGAALFLALAGFVSDVVTGPAVTASARREVEATLEGAQRIRKLPVQPAKWLSREAVAVPQGDRLRDGHQVRYMARNSEAPPWAFVVVESVAPFILRVNSGWAAGGQLGAGHEALLVVFFGWQRQIRSRPLWFF